MLPIHGLLSNAQPFSIRHVYAAGLISVALALTAWAQNSTTPATPAASTAFDKWLNEDVAYIITDEELMFSKRLVTDSERQQFIQQFWARRDPTPDTERNEFKEEHYRRIAYAKERFAFGTTSGWRTDRGRVYIRSGPPDEIESHPAGGSYERPAREGGGRATTLPFEQWRYRYIDGAGGNMTVEFVDFNRTGDFKVTQNPASKYLAR